MTIPDDIRQQKGRRMLEIFTVARQRYLDAGGDPLRSSNEKYMTEDEQKEFLQLGRQVFDEHYINNYRQKKLHKSQHLQQK